MLYDEWHLSLHMLNIAAVMGPWRDSDGCNVWAMPKYCHTYAPVESFWLCLEESKEALEIHSQMDTS